MKNRSQNNSWGRVVWTCHALAGALIGLTIPALIVVSNFGCETVESDEFDQLELCLYPSDDEVDQVQSESMKLPNEVPETVVVNQYKSWVKIFSGADLHNQDHYFEIDETCQITAGSPLEPVGKVNDMIWVRYLGPVGTEAHGSLCPAGVEFLMPEDSFLEICTTPAGR